MVDLVKDFELFKQGAEARLYTGTYLGMEAVAKERFPKKYRHPTLDQQLTRDRIKGEVRSLNRCKAIGIRTPTIYFADLESGLIVMERMTNAVTARDEINRLLASTAQDGPNGRLEAICRDIGSVLGRLHLNNVIHGDLTTSNILVDRKEVAEDSKNGEENEAPFELVLIDFGLGYAEGGAEDKGVDLYVLERAFLSTHPNTEHLLKIILNSYERAMKAKKKECAEIMAKFEEIRMRGRKRTMVG